MDWYRTVFEVIDMRSFSNLWYWIALAAVWSTATHYTLGVPVDMIGRAARHGGAAQDDLETMVRISVARRLWIARISGIWLVALACMLLTGAALLGFLYGVEFAQACFLIAFPMGLVTLQGLVTARRIEARGLSGRALRRALLGHRVWTQAIGVVSIFVTAMWGMYQNLALGVLR